MKKIICLSLLVFSLIGHAQNAKGTFELTPFIGFASSNYSTSEKNSNKPFTSTNLGVNVDYFFSNRWSLRSGLIFHTMGSKYQYNGSNTEKLRYVTIPANANWHFGKKRNWNLNFGLFMSFLTSATFNGDDMKDKVNSNQFGFNYGIGYTFKINDKFGILIDLQGVSGLTDVAKESSVSFTNVHSSFNIGGVFKL